MLIISESVPSAERLHMSLLQISTEQHWLHAVTFGETSRPTREEPADVCPLHR